jgi:hypothetical protein
LKDRFVFNKGKWGPQGDVQLMYNVKTPENLVKVYWWNGEEYHSPAELQDELNRMYNIPSDRGYIESLAEKSLEFLQFRDSEELTDYASDQANYNLTFENYAPFRVSTEEGTAELMPWSKEDYQRLFEKLGRRAQSKASEPRAHALKRKSPSAPSSNEMQQRRLQPMVRDRGERAMSIPQGSRDSRSESAHNHMQMHMHSTPSSETSTTSSQLQSEIDHREQLLFSMISAQNRRPNVNSRPAAAVAAAAAACHGSESGLQPGSRAQHAQPRASRSHIESGIPRPFQPASYHTQMARFSNSGGHYF